MNKYHWGRERENGMQSDNDPPQAVLKSLEREEGQKWA
jgi:hypothetical protein